MWEAFEHAAFYGLDNLIAIIDVNRLGQRGETMHGWDLDSYAEPRAGLRLARDRDRRPRRRRDRPRLRRGRRRAGHADGDRRPHAQGQGRQGGRGQAGLARQGARRPGRGDRRARRGAQHRRRTWPKPDEAEPHRFEAGGALELPTWELGEEVATRRAYGDALAALGASARRRGRARRRGLELDLRRDLPRRAPRPLLRDVHRRAADGRRRGRAAGAQAGCRSPRPSPRSSRRAYDFIRMAAISQANIRLCGSHAGVSIGEDGPSQMALEDLAMMRAVHGSTVLYPSDANQTAKLVAEMADREGIVYLRTTARGDAGRLRRRTRSSRSAARASCATGDDIAIVAAGITLHESLKAAEQLAGEGIEARVIDLYSVKPVDAETLRAAAEATGGRILTVEDHWSEGGIGDAVLEALSDGEAPRARGAARRARHARLGQARRAAERGRDRRRAHRRSGALARRRGRALPRRDARRARVAARGQPRRPRCARGLGS